MQPGPPPPMQPFRLCTANVTSWRRWCALRAHADVLLLQEARVKPEDVQELQRESLREGWAALPGQVVDGVHLLLALCRTSAVQMREVPMAEVGRHAGRMQHLLCTWGRGQALHLVHCYGYAEGARAFDKTLT